MSRPEDESGSPPDDADSDAGSPGVPPDDAHAATAESPTAVATADETDPSFFAPVDLTYAIGAVTLAALLIRLVALGMRPMHFDEARVAYWAWHYMESGSLTYRPVVHGPFIQIVDSFLFTVFGASDFLARLPIALAGGLLPATALLFREHLRKDEMIVLALFLSLNSILVYYGRFIRSDVLVAAFMFAAFGLLVRYYDTRRPRYLYGAAVLVGCGFASKENAIIYVLTWLGASVLVVDQALYRDGLDYLRATWVGSAVRGLVTAVLVVPRGTAVISERHANPRESARRIGRLGATLVGAGLVLLAVIVFFYADRGAGMAGIQRPPTPPAEGATGLWEALGHPLSFPGYAMDTLGQAATKAIDHWGQPAGSGGDASMLDTYIENIGRDWKVLAHHALVLGGFAIAGFLWERYGREHSRGLVMFAAYCGIASFLGYPLVDDIGGAHWLHVHVLVPLAVPAAVGVAGVLRYRERALVSRDVVTTFVLTFVVLLAAVGVVTPMLTSSFQDSTSVDNKLAQYAQPESQARDAVHAINTVSDGQGMDILVYTAENFSSRPLVGDPPTLLTRPICLGTGWYSSLPLPWYVEKADANLSCEKNPSAAATTIRETAPPLVVTNTADDSVPKDALGENYVPRTFEWFKYGHQVTFWVREDHVDEVPGWQAAG